MGTNRRNRYRSICAAAVLSLMMLAGCASLEQQDNCARCKNTVFVEAREYMLDGDQDLAIETLKEEMAYGMQKCTAAFYLFFLDHAREDYIEILNDPVCRSKYPLNDKIIQKYLSTSQKLEKYENRYRMLKKKTKNLSKLLKNSQKEKERLLFELKKLEQIRRETERLRLKK